jgi:DNA-binding NarL/FixJ family response regulator
MSVRIFLVDDHQMVRDGLRLRLEMERDFVVIGEAGSGAEAEAGVRQARPDVVVLDLHLPDQNGLTLLPKIRAALPGVKVLIITSSVDASLINEALQAGACGFLRKEDAASELVRAVRVALANKIYLSPQATTAMAEAMRQPASQAEAQLTDRELAVLKGVADGLSYKEIAAVMNVSVKSVETYRARLTRKLGFSTRAELIKYALRQRLVSP